MNNRTIHVRVEQRPTVPIAIALPVFFVLVGVGVSIFQTLIDNFLTVVSFTVVPAIIWFIFARQRFRRGAKISAVALTLTASMIVFAGLELSQIRSDREAAIERVALEEAQRQYYKIHPVDNSAECRNGIEKLKIGLFATGNSFDDCAKHMTSEEATEICSAHFKRLGDARLGWYGCSKLNDASARSH